MFVQVHDLVPHSHGSHHPRARPTPTLNVRTTIGPHIHLVAEVHRRTTNTTITHPQVCVQCTRQCSPQCAASFPLLDRLLAQHHLLEPGCELVRLLPVNRIAHIAVCSAAYHHGDLCRPIAVKQPPTRSTWTRPNWATETGPQIGATVRILKICENISFLAQGVVVRKKKTQKID